MFAKCGNEDALAVINAPLNATYTSPRVQNDLIKHFSNLVLQQISTEINQSAMFSILADETSTFSKEYLCIVLRFLTEELDIVEEFVGFENINETTGETISNKIIEQLTKLTIDMSNLIAQGYDGAANMSGKFKGNLF